MGIELTVMSLDFDSESPPQKQTFKKDEVNFGRTEDNDVVLPGEEVSNLHAKLTFDPGNGAGPQLFITDMGSVNGTLVDNVPLEPHKPVRLGDNQRILISGYLIKPKPLPKTEEELAEKVNEVDEADQAPVENVVTTEEVAAEQQVEEPPVQEEVAEIAAEEPSEDELVAPVEIKEPLQKPVQEMADIDVEEPVVHSPNESFAEATISTTIVAGEESVLEFDFEALKLCTVSGTITHKGVPLEGVRVDAELVSDASGSFSMENIEEGTTLSLTFVKAGYVFEPETLQVTVSDDETLSVVAKQLVTVKGRIQHRGQPLVGVQVAAKGIGETVTDAQGVYQFENVLEDTEIDIQVSKEGFVFKKK